MTHPPPTEEAQNQHLAVLPYRDNTELLHDLLSLGELLLLHDALRQQVVQAEKSGLTLHGIGQANRVDAFSSVAQLRQQRNQPDIARLNQELAQAEQELAAGLNILFARLQARQDGQVHLPLLRLIRLFALKDTDVLLIILGLLPFLDFCYTDAYLAPEGELQVQAAFLPISRAGFLFGYEEELSLEVEDGLHPNAPLMHWNLVQQRIIDSKPVYALSDAIRYYLIEANPPVPYLYAYLELLPAEAELEQFFIAQELKQAIATFLARTQTQERAADRFLVNLCSGDQSLLRRLTGTLARQLGMNCYQLNCSRLAEAVGRKNEADILRELPHMVRSCCRDLRLNNAALALSNTRMLSAELLHQLIKTAADILGVRYFFVLNGMARDLSRCLPTGSEQGWFLVDLHLSPPDTALREQIWLHAAQKNGIELGAEQAATLAANFTLTEEHISFALRDAVGIQLTRPAAELELASLAEACRAQTHRELQGIAQRLLTNHKLEDIVLFEETRSQVEEVLHHAQYRNKLMEDWGYAARTAASKNLSVLFHGPPGTGKTMAASACANALNLEIYRIDLATLLNKYIGETEKNLARLFDTAEAMNIILFFDEAEGLFSKRTEAQDSHDRFSNLQTGYILQRIETYNGIILLATNLLKNIDSAFVRRFKYMVEFPAPGPAQRLRMWQTAFPPALQLSPDIDFAFLADKVKLTGGGILNVSIAAALRAYNSGGLVGLEDILHAVEREYKKMGKVYDPFDFAVEQD